MKLLTNAQFEKLKSNGLAQDKVRGTSAELDLVPVVKLFNPYCAGTWLLTEILPENDHWAFGLADLNCDCVELGTIDLEELADLRHPLGFKLIERDRNWEATAPLSQYIKASRQVNRIVDHLPAPA